MAKKRQTKRWKNRSKSEKARSVKRKGESEEVEALTEENLITSSNPSTPQQQEAVRVLRSDTGLSQQGMQELLQTPEWSKRLESLSDDKDLDELLGRVVGSETAIENAKSMYGEGAAATGGDPDGGLFSAALSPDEVAEIVDHADREIDKLIEKREAATDIKERDRLNLLVDEQMKWRTTLARTIGRESRNYSYDDYRQMLEDEIEGNLGFVGARSKEEYRARQKSAFVMAGRDGSRPDDPILANRFEHVKVDVDGLDCADILFSAMRTKADNSNIMPRMDVRPGDRNDYAHLYREDGRKRAHAAMMHTLKKSNAFAFPAWWFSECALLWRLRHLHEDTHDYPEQYPIHDPKDMISVQAKFFRTLKNKPNAFSTLTDRRVQRNYGIGYPEKTPFSNTFIALEGIDDTLVYQRRLNQIDQVRQYSVPTSAYSPDGHVVPLDFIYCTGFLFSRDIKLFGAGTTGPNISGSMIWGIFQGYVTSHTHCPVDMNFLRIPMICPIYMQGLGKMEGEGPFSSATSGVLDQQIEFAEGCGEE